MIKYPKHLAIIMDGNGRWAQQKGRNRFWGHIKGTDVAQEIIEFCAKKEDIKYLTLYAFSTENWTRPQEEINFLFKLLERHLVKKRQRLIDSNVKLHTIGDLNPLPNGLKLQIDNLSKETQKNSGLTLTLALNYGGRQEIVQTVNKLILKAKSSSSSDFKVSESDISKGLLTSHLPDPDLILRTSGEQRTSNFLLWQSAYSEFYFSKTLWPDFTTTDLEDAFLDFTNRDRRFGGLANTKEAHV